LHAQRYQGTYLERHSCLYTRMEDQPHVTTVQHRGIGGLKPTTFERKAPWLPITLAIVAAAKDRAVLRE